MTTKSFDHQRLDVYRLSIEYVAASFNASGSLSGRHRHARDQWLRAAQSIPLNIAEGNGKRSRKDRARFLDIARGSALECAAIQDVLLATRGIKVQENDDMKQMLHRIVAMLTRMAMKFDGVAESYVGYDTGVDYEHCGSPRLVDTCGTFRIPVGGLPCPVEIALKNVIATSLNATP